MKTCKACGKTKPLEEFHKASKTPDRRQYRCKECSIAAARQRAIDNPEAKRAADRKYSASDKSKAKRKARREGPQRERILEQKRAGYYRNHDANLEKNRRYSADPESQRKQRERYARWRASDPRGVHRNNLKSFYGMTLNEWDALLVAQCGKCAICGCIPRELVIDHCHASGAVRALLCGACNTGLGQFKDDPVRLRAAADYIERHRREEAA